MAAASDADSLIQQELECGAFPDERLGKRLGRMLDRFADGTAESAPLACQGWGNTKAAYRFFANDRVTEADILAGHFRCTRERFSGAAGTILVLHDPTQLSYRRENRTLDWGKTYGGRQHERRPVARVLHWTPYMLPDPSDPARQRKARR